MKTASQLLEEAAAERARYTAVAERVAKGDETLTSEHLANVARSAAAAEAAAKAQLARETWDEWIPPFARHITGRWTRRVMDESGMPEPQRVEMVCNQCGARWQTLCSSGLVHGHVQKFALVHYHRDVFGYVPRKIPEDE